MSTSDEMNGDVPMDSSEIFAPIKAPLESTERTVRSSSTPKQMDVNSAVANDLNPAAVEITPVNSSVPADKKDNSAPPAQRKPRINRRNFHLINNPFVEIFNDKKPDQPKSEINGCKEALESKKEDASSKRIISLSSSKSRFGNSSDKIGSSKEAKIISLKKTPPSSFEAAKEKASSNEPSSAEDHPPKKKHKPITWP